MINFDSLSLKLFAKENISFFIGAKIQKIQQPNRSELIFSLRNNRLSRKLYINFNPVFYHLCFMSDDNEKLRNISIPKTAPMFCMLLRKYIQNAKILNIAVPDAERIFEIYFEYYDEMNEKSQLCLAIELMGKHSNVILYNYDTNVIIGCAHNVSSEKSRERELSGLMPYVYPPKQNKKNLTRVSFDSFLKNLDKENISKSISQTYNFLTVSCVEKLSDLLLPFTFENLFHSLKNFLTNEEYVFSILNDFSSYYLFKLPDSITYTSINSLIDDYFAYHQNKFLIENLKLKIEKNINLRIKKLQTLFDKQMEQVKKLDKALEYKNKADTIMANIYNLKTFQKQIKLYDFSGNELIIQMDINLTAVENANKYYNLYKKVKSSFEHAVSMIEDTKSQIMFFEEQKFFASKTNNIPELEEIYSELQNSIVFEKEKNIIVDNIEYLGFRIFIGKNKKQNDYILSKISSPEDLWFHPLNAPGAHILIKKNNKDEVIPDEVLLKAAEITKEYSSQKDNSKTSIIYTKRKYVKKANNKVAFVTYKNEEEIVI